MKNILVIAYYYPPKGGIGVLRNAKLAKYLNKLGYNVHVLSVKEEQCGSIIDHSLENDIRPGITVHRTSISEGRLIEKLISRVSRNNSTAHSNNLNIGTKKSNPVKAFIRQTGKNIFLNIYSLLHIPDAQKGWIKFSLEAGRKIIEENNIDVIYTTSSPYTSHLIGYKLAKEFSVKWIADFRDPWVSNSFVDYNYIVKRTNIFLERKVIKRADIVTSVSQPIIDDFLKRYPDQKKDKFIVITNGYDEEDYKNLDLHMSDSNQKFTILYSGTLYGKESPDNLFIAVENLIIKNRIDRNSIKVRFVGDMGSKQKEVFDNFKYKYPEIYERKEFVSHSESLEELCKANSLLLIIDDAKGNERIYTGKIFEYIRTGKPVIGIVPDGVARDLIIDTRAGYIAYPTKLEEIEEVVYAAYIDYLNTNDDFSPDREKIKEYSRERLAQKLDKIITSIT